MKDKSYRLIDAGNFRKLEQIGPYRIIRPSPQAVWRPDLKDAEWKKGIAAEFVRHSTGDGQWKIHDPKIKNPFQIKVEGISFVIKLTDFGHLGIFPEQYINWHRLAKVCRKESASLKVLNLFAYTGGSTLACCLGGAEVVHVDASKTSVAWARENAEASGLEERPTRWIVDDVKKFVAREIRRENRYHGIILDPPSYGRGSKGEVWKIELDLPDLIDDLSKILANDWKFVLLSSHSPGYTPIALQNLLYQLKGSSSAEFLPEEMIKTADPRQVALPSGTSCWAYRGNVNDLEFK